MVKCHQTGCGRHVTDQSVVCLFLCVMFLFVVSICYDDLISIIFANFSTDTSIFI